MLTEKELRRRNKLKDSKPEVYNKVLKYDEKIAKGESIAIVQLQYDYICNFSCGHCSVSKYRKDKTREPLNLEDIKNLSKQMDDYGLGHIDITGGEPTIFKDLDKLIKAVNPAKFYIQMDSNGYMMTKELAKHYKSIGIDRMQIGFDSLNEAEHDKFRNKQGAYKQALKAIDYSLEAGMDVTLATVVPHERVRSEELIQFCEFAKSKNIAIGVLYPKLVGEWEGRIDLLVTREDCEYILSLAKQYRIFDHLYPHYGLNLGCLAVKRFISINKFGDVMPCIWMYFKLGNIKEIPLKYMLAKGMKYFGKHTPICLVSESKEFNEKYISKTYGNVMPKTIEEIMGDIPNGELSDLF